MPATSPDVLAATCTRDLVAALRPAMEDLGKEMQLEMRELISVPVQYVAVGSTRPPRPNPIGSKPGPGLTQRPGAGHAVVRSKRGEPPRKEFGFLYKSMTTDTTVSGSRVITRMGSDDSIAGYAEPLEEQLDRPHFRTIFERVQNYAVDRILARLPQTI